MYSTDNQWPIEGIIDNQHEDRIDDFLSVNCSISDMIVYRDSNKREGKDVNDLVLKNTVGRTLTVANYFGGKEYQR